MLRRVARRRRVRWPRRGALHTVHADAIVHDRPSPRAWLLGRAVRLVVKPLLRIAPIDERSFARMRSIERLKPRLPRRGIAAASVDLGGVRAEQMAPADGTTTDLVILYFHGGGFFAGSIDSHRSLCERLVTLTGGTVVSVDYAMLPEATIAEAVGDAIGAYEALLDQVGDAGRIVVGGDSAGGYLTMKVAELATRRGLAPPAGLIGFSPLLSLDPERTDKNIRRVVRVRDAYLPIGRIALMRERWLPDGAIIEGFASPLHASAYIRSPVHLVAVEDELLRPETEAFAVLLTEKGVDVELHLWRGQLHAFVSLVDVVPDAELAVQLAADFALRTYRQA